MARAIDADALREKYADKLSVQRVFGYDAGFVDWIRAALEMPALNPQNEWVSVEDAAPDPGERVLATDGIFVGEAYRTSADSWHRHTGFPWRDGVTGRTVKYWMLLPAPPAKEGQK